MECIINERTNQHGHTVSNTKEYIKLEKRIVLIGAKILKNLYRYHRIE